MLKIIRTSSSNKDFVDLVKRLDADLAERDGDDHAFYHQFNQIDVLKHAVVLYEQQKPMGCGAIKEFNANAMEVKRMYTSPKARGKGFATRILLELEKWAKELSYEKCVLETGKRQPEAIQLYTKNGYNVIPNYGQYKGITNSICFQKVLKQ
jgi:GNAT superfamily N-acetyltransferase